MIESYDSQRISSSIGDLTREVCSLRSELSLIRSKLGLQPEWLFFITAVAIWTVIMTLIFISAGKKDTAPSSEPPRMEAQRELPER